MTTTMTSISKTKQEAFNMFGIKRKSTIINKTEENKH